MVLTWKITINLSGENHVYYRKASVEDALYYARRQMVKDCGISLARVRSLHYEIEATKEKS